MILGMLLSRITGWLVIAVLFGALVLLMTIAIHIWNWRRHRRRIGLLNVLVLMQLVISIGVAALSLSIDTGHEPGWLTWMGGTSFIILGIVIAGAFVASVAYSFHLRQRLE